MKLEIPAAAGGGVVYVETSGDYGVVLAGMWMAVPVFHRLNRSTEPGPRERTNCGRDVWWRDDDSRRIRGDWLPLRHLVKFARPCARCWP